MSELLVQARNVSHRFLQGQTTIAAVIGASCQVRNGDRVAVMGPSGSGKSTLLHILGGIGKPTSGEVSWPALGPAQSLRPTKVASTFQQPSLEPTLNAVENVELPLLLAERLAGARAAAMSSLALLGLAELAEKLPEELSGGQAQRVALARALVCQPRLVLADEPTGQLDRETASHLLDMLLGHLDGTGAALVVATHDPFVADHMTTVWRMRYGILDTEALP